MFVAASSLGVWHLLKGQTGTNGRKLPGIFCNRAECSRVSPIEYSSNINKQAASVEKAMTPESLARIEIDSRLEKAGWIVQDLKKLDLSAGLGIAVREYPTDTGPADYVLFIARNAKLKQTMPRHRGAIPCVSKIYFN